MVLRGPTFHLQNISPKTLDGVHILGRNPYRQMSLASTNQSTPRFDGILKGPNVASNNKGTSNFNKTPEPEKLIPRRPEVSKTVKEIKPFLSMHENMLNNDHPGFNRLDNASIAKMLEDSKKQKALPNILKTESQLMSKRDYNSSNDNTESILRIKDRMQQTFQRKDNESPKFMPSVKFAHEDHSKPNSRAGSIKSPSFRIKNINSPTSSVRRLQLERKRDPNFGSISARGNINSQSESFAFSSFVASQQKAPNGIDNLKLSNFASNANEVKQPEDSRSSPIKFKLDLGSGLVSPQSERLSPLGNDIIKEARTSRYQNPSQFRVTSQEREKLNKIFEKDLAEEFTERIAVKSPKRISNENNIDQPAKLTLGFEKNDLDEAIAEYKNNVYDKFKKSRKGKFLYEKQEDSEPIIVDENVKKWTKEMPPRKVFTIATPNIPNGGIPDLKQNSLTHRSRIVTEQRGGPSLQQLVKKQTQIVEEPKGNNNQVQTEKSKRFKRARQCLLNLLLKYANLKISLQDLVKNKKIFPQKPYEKEGSEKFMKAVKQGNYSYVQEVLKTNKYYVFEFDSAKQTALHWAAKRGHQNLCKLLLEYGADPDAKNLGERTPLYYALKEKYSEVVRILLCGKADPWTVGKINYKMITEDIRSILYLKKARQISIILKFQPPADRQTVWEKEVKHMFTPIRPTGDEQQNEEETS